MKHFLIKTIALAILILAGCTEVYIEIKVIREPASDVPAKISLSGSAIGVEQNWENVILPWSYTFISEEGKVVNVRACCGLQAEDFGIKVEAYKDGSLIGSKRGYSPFVHVVL